MARDAAEIARLSADAMWSGDKASQGLGMDVLEVGPGHARLAMTVTERMLNGHGSCHGGFIFTLADQRFCVRLQLAWPARRSHSIARSPTSRRAGSACGSIAEAQERQRGERSGIYDVTVRDETGTVIAEFRGHSRTLPGSLIDGAE